MAKPLKQIGRPSLYSEDLTDRILERLIAGESLRKVCGDEEMPDAATVFRWLEADPAFASRYARARQIQADVAFDQLQEIADEGNAEDTARAKLRVDTLKWRLAKLLPKKYGDQVPNAPPQQHLHLHATIPVDQLSTATLREIADLSVPE
jgi:hypothetical protein